MPFQKGHIPWDKGIKRKDICREKHYRFGKPCPQKVREALSRANKGRSPWNKGKKLDPIQKAILRKHWEDWASKHLPPHLGKKHSVESRAKMSKARMGQHNSVKTQFKKGHKPACPFPKGHIPFSKLHPECMPRGENNSNWRGGISFESYSKNWNTQLKELIRDRDGRKCQLCGVPEIECIEKLHIHHIDYNKKNFINENLISLCRKCHMKTNFKRNYWTDLFSEKIMKEW